MAQFRQDRMTEEERMEALLNRQPVDRVPLYLFPYGFAAVSVGYSILAIYSDPKKYFQATLHTHEMFDGWPYFDFEPGLFPARAFGSQVQMPTSEYAQAPSLLRPVVESEKDG